MSPKEIQLLWRQRVFAVAHLAAIVAVIVAVLWWFFTRPAPYHPFGTYILPQEILGKKTVYRPGDTVYVKAVKCYRSRSAVAFTGVSYLLREKPYRLVVMRKFGFGVVNPSDLDANGCATHTFGHVLPNPMPSGTWRFEGQETARLDRDQVTVAWYTEPFNVKQGK